VRYVSGMWEPHKQYWGIEESCRGGKQLLPLAKGLGAARWPFNSGLAGDSPDRV